MRFWWIFVMLLVMISCRSNRHHKTGYSDKNDLAGYEQKLGIQLPQEINRKYIAAISDWLGVPYKYGGNSTDGTDCSGLVQSIYLKVYNKAVDHNSAALFKKASCIDKKKLKEGDLLFFRIDSEKISHVGMHITNDYFVHASTKKGVVISSVSEPYYKKAFAGYGTFRE